MAFLWLPGCKQNGVVQSVFQMASPYPRLEACQSLPEIQKLLRPFRLAKVESHEVHRISAPQQRPAIQIHLRNADITIPDGTNPRTIRATLLALKELC